MSTFPLRFGFVPVLLVALFLVGCCRGLTTTAAPAPAKQENQEANKLLFVADLRPSAILGEEWTTFYRENSDTTKEEYLEDLLTEQLTKVFGQYGNIEKLAVHGIREFSSLRKQKRRRRPYAFITYSNETAAALALDHKNTHQQKKLFRKISFSSVPDSWRKLPPKENVAKLSSKQEQSVSELIGCTNMNMILQVNKSHLYRMLEYMEKRFSSITVNGFLESTSRTKLSLIFLQHNNKNDASLKSFIEESLSPDPFIHKALNRVYTVNDGDKTTKHFCKSEEEVCIAAMQKILEGQASTTTTTTKKRRIKVQVFPPSIQEAVLESLEQSLPRVQGKNQDVMIEISPSNSTHILSVVRLLEPNQSINTENDAIFLWGIEEAWTTDIGDGHNIESTSTSGDVSRAYYKLKEALARTIPPAAYCQLVAKSKAFTAIDCGAAPGGWTKYLSLNFDCKTVYSVDPGQLDPSVTSLPGVVHLPIKAETAIQQLAAQNVCLDIWVSDMCLHDMNQQVDILKDAIRAGIVKKNALFCLTLKCTTGHSKGAHDKQVALAVQGLNGVASNITVTHLFSNRKGERTVVGLVL